MKSGLSRLCGAAALVLLGGCSVHPLPQDISYASTADIVRRVRCEAKEGIDAALDKAARQGPEAKKHADNIVKVSLIGFEFKLTMAEDERANLDKLRFERASVTKGDGFSIELIGNFNGVGKVGPAADDNRTRKNTRNFRVIDRLEKLKEARCGRVEPPGPNVIYPITGSTGMGEVVQTYIELEALTRFEIAGERPTGAKDKDLVLFSDKLDFTTTLEAGATTEWTFSTSVGTLRLTKASLSGSALRKDIHSVTVAIARDGEPDPPAPRGSLRAGRAMVSRDATTGASVPYVRDRQLQVFLAQKAAVARNKILIELERRRHVDENRDVAARVLGLQLP
jgi:hypothetical protein